MKIFLIILAFLSTVLFSSAYAGCPTTCPTLYPDCCCGIAACSCCKVTSAEVNATFKDDKGNIKKVTAVTKQGQTTRIDYVDTITGEAGTMIQKTE